MLPSTSEGKRCQARSICVPFNDIWLSLFGVVRKHTARLWKPTTLRQPLLTSERGPLIATPFPPISISKILCQNKFWQYRHMEYRYQVNIEKLLLAHKRVLDYSEQCKQAVKKKIILTWSYTVNFGQQQNDTELTGWSHLWTPRKPLCFRGHNF